MLGWVGVSWVKCWSSCVMAEFGMKRFSRAVVLGLVEGGEAGWMCW